MAINEKLSLPKLKGTDNYIIWSLRAKAYLIEKGYYSALLDNEELPIDFNNKALAIIYLLCEDGPLLHIRDITSAKAAWEKLENLYNPKGFTTDYLILREFFNSTLNEYSSIEEYLNKIKELVDNLKSKEINLPDQVVISWVLYNLDNSYESFISSVI